MLNNTTTMPRSEQPARPATTIAPADPDETRPLAFVDCETTGLDPSAGARILSLAVLPAPSAPGARLKPCLFHLMPPENTRFEDDSLRVHGLTREELARLGARPFADSWPEIRDSLRKTLPDDCLWLAHNAPFDAAFLAAELHAAGDTGHPLADPLRWRCTLAWSRRHWPTAGHHSLDAIARRLGIPAANRRARGATHEADADTILLALCWREAHAAAQPAPPDLFAAHGFNPDNKPSETTPPLPLPPLTAAEREAHEAFARQHGLRAVPEPAAPASNGQ